MVTMPASYLDRVGGGVCQGGEVAQDDGTERGGRATIKWAEEGVASRAMVVGSTAAGSAAHRPALLLPHLPSLFSWAMVASRVSV